MKVEISQKYTNMMQNCCGRYSLVDQETRQVLDRVHGGHVDHNLGVRGKLSRVEYVEITVIQ